MKMHKVATLLTLGAAAYVLAGCSASGVNPTNPSRVCNLGSNVLQLNVGTANLFADVPAAHVVGTNVAVTYRQSSSGNCYAGNSGALVSSPTLTIPTALAGPAGTADGFGATIVTGPGPLEIGTGAMTPIGQTPAQTNNTALATTFGDSGGAFGLGLEPFNYAGALGTAGVGGSPASVYPYQVPLYDAIDNAGAGPDPNQFLPGGGAPAFNVAGNQAAILAGFNAISLGLDVFEVTPAVGTYSLSVAVPANTGTVTASASAPITTVVTLPPFVAPIATVVTPAGGATFTYVLPAGVTQAYIEVIDYGPTSALGSCLTSPAVPTATNPVYYTFEVTASGTSTLPAGSICTAAQNTTADGAPSDGDAFTVQGIGFDYSAYQASYPNSLGVTSPSLVGAGVSHQADVTISSQGVYNLPAGGGALINGGGGAVLPTGALSNARARGQASTRK
jgi:hypothetical protein